VDSKKVTFRKDNWAWPFYDINWLKQLGASSGGKWGIFMKTRDGDNCGGQETYNMGF